ncbi:MAG: hypothetical protein M1839_008412 [Geoglossum umbratile]|nr:MAG: hypothetical protein M1839_008412 [Geoglossum umbratile]
MPGPGIPYKWENFAALDHKCGVCDTVLSNPKARKTCFGKHEEPCPMFHGTVFLLGTFRLSSSSHLIYAESHKCDPCRKSREQHYKRHREIALVVRKIHEWDARNELTAPTKGRRKTNNSPITTGEGGGSSASQVPALTSPKDKREKKLAEKQRERNTPLGVSSAAINDVDRILHPPATSSIADNGNGFDEWLRANLTYNAREIRFRRLPDPFKVAIADGGRAREKFTLLVNLLAELGVDVNKSTSRDRKVLVTRLTDIIIRDMTVVNNESREVEMRRGGYWRYVYRGTKDEMDRTAEEWIWGEGEKTKAASVERRAAWEGGG